jgi:riboflavin transporter FmnP
MNSLHTKTTKLAGTAVLGALTVVFDYTLKFSGLKIPFPLFPTLKFDFTGIPIVLSYLLFGFSSGATTSSIAFLAILFRSGDAIGPLMKAIAELSTIAGMALFTRRTNRIGKAMSITLGLVLRVAVMSVVNLIVLPIFYAQYYTFSAAVLLLPLIGVFNIIQGSISIFGGLLIHKAIAGKIPLITHRLTS